MLTGPPKRYLANVIRTARLPPLGEIRHIVQYDDGEVESLDLAQERFKVLRVVAPHEGGGVPPENPPKAASSLKVVLRGAGGGGLAEPGPVLGKRQRRLTPAMANLKEEQLMKALIKQQKTGGGGGGGGGAGPRGGRLPEFPLTSPAGRHPARRAPGAASTIHLEARYEEAIREEAELGRGRGRTAARGRSGSLPSTGFNAAEASAPKARDTDAAAHLRR